MVSEYYFLNIIYYLTFPPSDLLTHGDESGEQAKFSNADGPSEQTYVLEATWLTLARDVISQLSADANRSTFIGKKSFSAVLFKRDVGFIKLLKWDDIILDFECDDN